MSPLARLLVPALAGLLLPSCGYSTARLDRIAGAHTIAVAPFANAGYRRDLELRLTEAVLEELRARSSWRLAPLGRSDYVLTGTIEADEAVAIQRDDRTVVQQQFRGTVQVELRDARSGRVVKRYPVYAVTEFTPDQAGESLQGSATRELLRRLAIRVVQGLEAGF